MSEAAKKRLLQLEQKHPSSDNTLPMGTSMVKGWWVHENPDVCRALPKPDAVGEKAKIHMWRPSDNIEVWDAGNWHLLPCYGCEYFGVKCNGYSNLKFDLEDIRSKISASK
jgi:hypothetical protein